MLFIPLLSAHSQDFSLKKILCRQLSTVKDTIFHLKTAENVTAEIPAALISGREKGPTLTVVAGIHGTEYAAIAAVQQLRKEIDPEKLKGNLILIPVLNMDSFFSRTSDRHPLDKQDLNRAFPGNPSGSITELTADFITTRIFDATDIFIELHGGDGTKALLPFISYYNNKEFAAQTQLASRLCEISGFNTIVRYPYTLMSGQPAVYAFRQAVRLGIPSLSVYCSNTLSVQNTAPVSIKNALYNIMNELHLYEKSNNSRVVSMKTTYSQQTYIVSPGKGFFRSVYKPGEKISKDEEIGYITDIFGGNIQIITAPHSGTILSKIVTPSVTTGETLFFIGY